MLQLFYSTHSLLKLLVKQGEFRIKYSVDLRGGVNFFSTSRLFTGLRCCYN